MKYLYNPPSIIKYSFNDFIWKSKEDKILITFDDGPNAGTTEIILKALNGYKIKAAFLCVGNNLDKNPGLVKEILSEGHLIGNHTYNHTQMTKVEPELFRKGILDVQRLMKDRHGYEIKYFRPPHGKFNLKLGKILKEYNLKNIMWTLLTYDYKNDINIVKFSVQKYLLKNSIVVLHDSEKSKNIISESIDIIVSESSKHGFTIGKPEECLK